MSNLIQIPIESMPGAAILVVQDVVRAYNDAALRALSQLRLDQPLPAYLRTLPRMRGTGSFQAGTNTYDFSFTPLAQGDLLLFERGRDARITPAQLEGALRQLRTHMEGILLNAQNTHKSAYSIFLKNYHSLFRLVENLDFLHLKNADAQVPFQPLALDFVGLCQRVIQQAAQLLASCDIELKFCAQPATLLLTGDAALLQRLLLELISNSAGAVGQGVIDIQLQAKDQCAVLTVTDSGNPTKRQIDALLQQPNDALPTPNTRAGLGLSVVRQIAAWHNGSTLISVGEHAPVVAVSLPLGAGSARTSCSTPRLQRDGGLSPLLTALADVLPAHIFGQEELF